MKSSRTRTLALRSRDYGAMLDRIFRLIDEARHVSARTVNALMTATYWSIGRHIVEFEQQGKTRAEYGEQLLKRMATDLAARYGRGYSLTNLKQFRHFYLAWPALQKEKGQTLSDQLAVRDFSARFPLPWSAYVSLLSVKNEQARKFYETEALRGGWSVRQLDRQINSLFYERIALSRNKAKMLTKGAAAKTEDTISAEEEIKDPYVLEFLGLKDEYSESDIEEALPTLVTWRRFLFGVLPGIGEDEVTNHSLVTRVSFTRFALEKRDGFAVESQSYLLFLVQFAHELIERRKLAFWDSAQFPNDLTFVICISNRFFLHRFFCLFANSLRR